MQKLESSLTFNEENHEYRLNGLVIPSVTQIIEWVFRSFDGVKESFLEEASWRGTCVHKAVYLHELSILDWNTLDTQFVPYLEAWILFKKQTGFITDPEFMEKPCFHPVYKYGMTPDIPGSLFGVKTLLDIKTGNILPIAALQLAAYQEGINATKPKEKIKARYAIQLKKDGKYKLSDEFKTKTDFNTFLCAMSVYNWKGNNYGKHN